MLLFFGILKRLFGGKKGAPGLSGKPISCLKCGATFSVKGFSKTNGVCQCGHDRFSFLTDDVPDDELEANKDLSAGAKFVLDADDHHMKDIEGRKLIIYLRNQGLVK